MKLEFDSVDEFTKFIGRFVESAGYVKESEIQPKEDIKVKITYAENKIMNVGYFIQNMSRKGATAKFLGDYIALNYKDFSKSYIPIKKWNALHDQAEKEFNEKFKN